MFQIWAACNCWCQLHINVTFHVEDWRGLGFFCRKKCLRMKNKKPTVALWMCLKVPVFTLPEALGVFKHPRFSMRIFMGLQPGNSNHFWTQSHGGKNGSDDGFFLFKKFKMLVLRWTRRSFSKLVAISVYHLNSKSYLYNIKSGHPFGESTFSRGYKTSGRLVGSMTFWWAPSCLQIALAIDVLPSSWRVVASMLFEVYFLVHVSLFFGILDAK